MSLSLAPTSALAPRGGGGMAPPGPLTKAYSTYGAATQTQAGDYDRLMGNYNDLYAKLNNPNNNGQYTPALYNYQRSGDLNSALGNAGELSRTGGYSTQDIQNLRERGVSPIRSVYASAQRNIDRQRALQGGYSPNYTAATAKMARDESEQIAGQMSNVNAGIAQNVASNRLQGTSTFGNLASGENEQANRYGAMNTNAQNEASQFNNTVNNNRNQQALGALQGATNLYGTTPALVNTFGNQAMQSANLQNNITQGNNNSRLRQLSTMVGVMGS